MLGIVVSTVLEINHNKVSSHSIVTDLLELAQAAVEVLLDVARGIKLVWRGFDESVLANQSGCRFLLRYFVGCESGGLTAVPLGFQMDGLCFFSRAYGYESGFAPAGGALF